MGGTAVRSSLTILRVLSLTPPHYAVIGGWVRPLSDSDCLLMLFPLGLLKLSSVSDLAPVESYLGTRVLPVLSFYQYSTFEMLA